MNKAHQLIRKLHQWPYLLSGAGGGYVILQGSQTADSMTGGAFMQLPFVGPAVCLIGVLALYCLGRLCWPLLTR